MATEIGNRLWRFHGGLKLRNYKVMSTDHAVLHGLPIPEQLILPISQHMGIPARPVVEPGDKVLKGQVVAIGDGFVSASVHAPSSGTVTAIAKRLVPSAAGGTMGISIVLETDGEDKWIQRDGIRNFETLAPDEIRARVSNAGIVGLGGAVFPSHIKLMRDIHQTVETVILNGVECEPYISCDEMLMRERAVPVVTGGRMMRHALEAKRCIIAIEDHMELAGRVLREVVAEIGDDRVSVVDVPTIYPQGGERQLIETLTGQQVPSGGLPVQIGVVCHNVATAAAVQDAITDGIPLISRYVTVTGPGVKNPSNVEALIGTPLSQLIEACGGYTGDVPMLIVGGPMMGYAMSTDDLPVIKATNCVLALVSEDVRETQEEMPCIGCMECVNVCPADLLPQTLFLHAKERQLEQARSYGIFDCIECGCCAYVCPSHIPLVDYYRVTKNRIWKIDEQRQKAEHARRRHEFRERRRQRQETARTDHLRERERALDTKDPQDAIAEAVKRSRQHRARRHRKDKD